MKIISLFLREKKFTCIKCKKKYIEKLKCPLLVEYEHITYKRIINDICIKCFILEKQFIEKNKSVELKWL